MEDKEIKKEILYIVIPAYNEEENIGSLIEEWYPVVKKHSADELSRLVLVNDGSTDDTLAAANKSAEDKPLVEIISKENGGHGRAVTYGYRYALENGADYIFQTDSDRQTSPDEFEGFWRQRDRFDVVIGSRYMREDGFCRAAVSKASVLILASLLRVNVKDPNTPYRLMKAESLKKALAYIEDDETIPNIMLSAVFKRMKCKVLFRDIHFRARQGGVNSIDLKKISKIGSEAVGRLRSLDKRLKADGL